MICVLASTDPPIEKQEKLIDYASSKVRILKQQNINIVFLADSSPKAFKYRDIFTKFIDIGVRVYIESDLRKLKDIIEKNCRAIYTLLDDTKISKIIESLGISIPIEYV